MPGLHIIALGGTIASTRTPSAGEAGTAGGVSPAVGAAEIAAAADLSSLPGGAPELSFEQLAQVGSGSITLDILAEVVAAAHRARAAGATGIVLTQGTDTLADSAFVLALTNDSGLPIVLTGAMRNPTLPGADGPANVRAAALTALDPRSAALPSLLVFADEIHSPLDVVKAHTTHPAPFIAPGLGPLGWLSEDRVILARMPASLPGTLPAEADAAVPEASVGSVPEADGAVPEARVALISVGLDDDLAFLPALASSGYAGAVIAGVGGGHVPAGAVETVAELAGQMPVVLASRTGAGAVLESTYGYPGAEIDLLTRGLIPAGTLQAEQARLLLMLGLRRGLARPQLTELFTAFRG